MLVFLCLLLSTPEVSLLQPTNMSSARMGRIKLLEDLRAHSAFTQKVSPSGDNNNTVHINFSFLHYEVLMVDEIIQSVASLGYITMTWEDSDLTWNHTDYDGVDMVTINYGEIWHPHLIVSNAADPDYVMIERSESISLTSTGFISYSTQAHLKSTCDIDVTYYPFDTQHCDIVFVPYIYDTNYSISATSVNNYDEVVLTGEWNVTDTSITTLTPQERGGMTIVRFTMTIRRRVLYYLLCVLAPMMLTGFVTSVVFLLPPNAGEKITFLVTVFVTEAVFLNFIAGAMPRNMSGIPRLPLFLVIINVQCVLAMVATVFVIRRHDAEQRDNVEHQQENSSQQCDDKLFVCQAATEEETEPQVESTNIPSFKNRLSISFIQKLSVWKKRLTPVVKPDMQVKNKIPQTTRRCCLRSSTWNTIFFWTFNLMSILCYFLVFMS